jgi:hypothetical protein
MSPRIKTNRIDPIYLLNSPIDKLNEEGYFTVRVYLNLRAIKVKNLAELRALIFNSRTSHNEKLALFGGRSVQEVNELFHRANIKIPEFW